MRLLRTLAAASFAAATAVIPATPAMGVSSPAVDSAVGAGGTFYQVHAGRFGDLFGANPALPPERQVLALDIVVPGQPRTRWVVPGTEAADVEGSPALLWDDRVATLHIVWSRSVTGNQPHAQLLLRSLTPTAWSELVDLSGGSLAEKSALRLLETADEYTTTVGEAVVVIPRRILHLVWLEDDDAGTPHALYSPILFVDGRYVGWNPVVALDDLVTAETPSPVAPTDALRRAPVLAPGRDDDRVVVGFVHAALGRLATVEIQVLPGEVGELADRARGSIIELGQTMFPTQIPALAEGARGSIIELATTFHPAVASLVADGAAAALLAADPALGLAGVADEARGSIIELANGIQGGGLANDCSTEGALLEVPPLVPQDGSDFSHFLQLRSPKAFGAPEIGAGAVIVLVSPDGTRALVGWTSGALLHYRETMPEGFWSEVRTLDLDQVPSGDAFVALAGRIAGR
jgi:hypothetical protein